MATYTPRRGEREQGASKIGTNEPICRTETDSQTLKTNVWLTKEKGVGDGLGHGQGAYEH